MPTPGEHKTVQAWIFAYAQEIGWTIVSRVEAERRRVFDLASSPEGRATNRILLKEHEVKREPLQLQDLLRPLFYELMTAKIRIYKLENGA